VVLVFSYFRISFKYTTDTGFILTTMVVVRRSEKESVMGVVLGLVALVIVATLSLGCYAQQQGPVNYYCANTGGLRMRSGPGLAFQVVYTLSNGAKTTDFGDALVTADGVTWRHITYNQYNGWSANNYLR